VRFEVAAGAARELPLEAPALFGRIVQLAEGVGHLEAADIELECSTGPDRRPSASTAATPSVGKS